MDPREIEKLRRLTEIMNTVRLTRLLKALEDLKRIRQAQDVLRHQEALEALKAHKEEFLAMSDEEREVLRERADYDEQAWQEILKQLAP